MCREFLSRPARFEIAITIGKSNDAIRICHIQKPGIVAGRIKSNAEWFVQIAFCKSFSDIRFAVAVGIAQHLDLIGVTLYNEDVAIRSALSRNRGSRKPAGVQIRF